MNHSLSKNRRGTTCQYQIEPRHDKTMCLGASHMKIYVYISICRATLLQQKFMTVKPVANFLLTCLQLYLIGTYFRNFKLF